VDRTAFEYVYLHAHCIAELGLVRALVAAAAAPAPAVAPAAPAAPVAPTPVVDDESAVDGILGFGALTPEQLAEQVARVEAALRDGSADGAGAHSGGADAPAPGEEPFAVAIGVGFLDPEWGEPDVGLYLEQAYAARESLQARIDDAFARVDAVALDEALACLAADLPPLTADLDAEALEGWLKRYDGGDAALAQVVAQVRRLEPVI